MRVQMSLWFVSFVGYCKAKENVANDDDDFTFSGTQVKEGQATRYYITVV